jgi:hypothetical protein
MRNLSRLIVLGLLSLLVFSIGAVAVSSARDRQPAPARDGRYGALRGDELIGFKVKDRVVEDLFFNMRMECHNTDTGEDYERYFDATQISGGRASFDGHWRRNYETESNGRQGSGRIEVDFHRNGKVFASVSVVVPGGGESFETCYGFFATKVKRGPPSRS